MMDQTQLLNFERLCTNLYDSKSSEDTRLAHDTLMPLMNQFEAIPRLEFVLRSSQNGHAVLFAATSLIRLVTDNWSSIPVAGRDEMKSFLSSYLTQNCLQRYSSHLHEQAMPFVIRLFCRIVKLSWLDGPSNQSITSDMEPLLTSKSFPYSMLAIDIYIALTAEMQPAKGPQMSRYRRTAMSFRDVALAHIFQSAVNMLRDINEGRLSLNGMSSQDDESRLLHKLLKLVLGSLSFDFMGTIPDESADEQATVMIPYNWANAKDLSQPSLFFDLYSKSVRTNRMQCALLSLECLVLFASLRRSLYSKEDERSAILASFMRGTSNILMISIGLKDEDCYHELCRLLGRVNTANQVTELAANPQFAIWLDQVYAFTLSALDRTDWLVNSMRYLMGFWTALVPSIMTMGEKAPVLVRQYLEQLTMKYVTIRLQMAATNDDIMVGILEDETLLMEILDVVSILSRLHATKVVPLITQSLSSVQHEHTLAWIVYLFGAVLSGLSDGISNGKGDKTRSSSVDDYSPKRDRADSSSGGYSMADEKSTQPMSPPLSIEYLTVGEILKQVFGIMSKTDAQHVTEDLELSYLYFLEQFRKLFFAEQQRITGLVSARPETGKSSKLCTAIGLTSDHEIIDLFVSKLFSNFQKRKKMDTVSKKSLAFLKDMVNSTVVVYMTDPAASGSTAPLPMSEALCSNPKIKYILEHPEEIGFSSGRDSKHTTTYYCIVFKLLFTRSASGTNTPVNWSYFDRLFLQLLNKEGGISRNSSADAENVLTLARSLRGISSAATTAEQYNVLYKYLVEYPKNPAACKLGLFSNAVGIWWDEPQVVGPILKFVAEFAHNRGQRIDFPQNSPNGLVLFKEAMKVLSVYGQRILQRPANFVYQDIYEEKYKGVGGALKLFTNTLAGNYANFGIFELYGDNSLSLAMSTALNLCLSIPIADLGAYLKALKSVYTFLEHCTKSHMQSILQLGAGPVCHIFRSLEEGLTSFDTAVALSSCVAIDNICTYCIETVVSGEEKLLVDSMLANSEFRGCIGRSLSLGIYLAMSGEFASTWSLSRPLLGLILIGKGEFGNLHKSTIEQQITPERKTQVEKCFRDLMTGIADNLTSKNRETFTKNLYQFGISLRSN